MSPVRRDSNSPSSTVSPSQPLQQGHIQLLSQPHESSSARSCALVDLTTPEQPVYGSDRSQVYKAPRSDHQRRIRFQVEEGRFIPASQSGLVVRRLPDDVRGPHPRGGRSKFSTHITKTLERVSTRVPLPKYFRPAYVARDVGVLERGYWQFFITINDRRAGKSRRSSGEQTKPHWTEKEFSHFWQAISLFIQQGKAGWGTRLLKESRDSLEWRIRLFTWGELLGHIWVILWILSDKLTQSVPMQWFAGDGSVVVQMSGAKPRRRKSSLWMRKGPEGEGGAWGMGRLEAPDLKPGDLEQD
ncbi:hypothetical protein A1O1_05448 [Capronia coronata CBS 617.96]|uniref:Uncharacterized protein n=1 Tax=Capronia coronata CBS 617.96 TaxID=1182541 RepID=W9Y7L7_9EURO|nr:uncharacterized protein A1O1_05448 [Capronia coronata CBS 617.96]EXJ88518.1 hypothetical protein A1O1_05448 [Capronia coronata CBS 617.96]